MPEVDPEFRRAAAILNDDDEVKMVSDMIMQLAPQITTQMGVAASAVQAAIFVQAAGSVVGMHMAIEQEGVDAYKAVPQRMERLQASLDLAKLAVRRLEEAMDLLDKGTLQ